MITISPPTPILIAPSTQASKNFFILILEEQLIPHLHISSFLRLNCTLAYQINLLLTFQYVQWMKADFKILSTIEADENSLVVLEYQMSEAAKLEATSNLFIKGSHHRNITVVYIVQNAFAKGKVHRTISLNSFYMVLFIIPRDEGQMRSLAQHVFPTKVKFFMDSFREATKKDHGYLHPLTPDPLPVRTSIFKSDEVEIFAPTNETKEANFDLDPLGYIMRLE